MTTIWLDDLMSKSNKVRNEIIKKIPTEEIEKELENLFDLDLNKNSVMVKMMLNKLGLKQIEHKIDFLLERAAEDGNNMFLSCSEAFILLEKTFKNKKWIISQWIFDFFLRKIEARKEDDRYRGHVEAILLYNYHSPKFIYKILLPRIPELDPFSWGFTDIFCDLVLDCLVDSLRSGLINLEELESYRSLLSKILSRHKEDERVIKLLKKLDGVSPKKQTDVFLKKHFKQKGVV